MNGIKEVDARISISKYFDSEWYVSQYIDVVGGGIEPILHYLRHGAEEGRWPRADFDSAGYLIANPDVAASGMNPFVHWVIHGRKEGRSRVAPEGGRTYSGDLNEILPECFKSISWVSEHRVKGEDFSFAFQKFGSRPGIYGLSIAPVNFPIVLYSADLTPVSNLKIHQALSVTSGQIVVLNSAQKKDKIKDGRLLYIEPGEKSETRSLLEFICGVHASKIGLWEASLDPAISAWPLLSATIDCNPLLTYVGASLVRLSGLLWRSGHCVAQQELRAQGKDKYFLDPLHLRLKPSAAIDPLFGLFRADQLAAALQAATDAHGERVAVAFANLSSVEKAQRSPQNEPVRVPSWATQGCALVMSDTVPPLHPILESTILAPDEAGVKEGFVFVDSVPPRPDQDAGSVTAANFLDILLSRNCDVFFFSTMLREWSDPYVLSLAARGVICLSDGIIPDYNAACDHIRHAGYARLVFFMTRVYAGGEYVELTRGRFPRARLIFNTVDLHGLRELREAKISGSQSGLFSAYATSARERDIIRRCDATILLSEVEAEELTPKLGYANLQVIPLVAEFSAPKNKFSDRDGVLFIGSFVHQPNVDAIEYMFEQIWPNIHRQMRSIKLTIIGPNFPDKLQSHLPEGVEVAGFVEDLRGALERARVTIAPLRYGAGIKGKIATSLSHGVPCVATTLAAEGMGMTHGRDVLIADDPGGFAASVVELHENEELWLHMSRGGYDFAESRYSRRAVAFKLNSMLDALF